jgi:hypothetical protein
MFDPARLVFIDETAASTKMVRLRGRCPRSGRLVGSVPHGHWKTITLVAGLRNNGIVAPFVIDGPMNGGVFLTYIEQCLAPTLDHGAGTKLSFRPYRLGAVTLNRRVAYILLAPRMLRRLPNARPLDQPVQRSSTRQTIRATLGNNQLVLTSHVAMGGTP